MSLLSFIVSCRASTESWKFLQLNDNMKELGGTHLSKQIILSTIVIQSVKQYSFYSLFV